MPVVLSALAGPAARAKSSAVPAAPPSTIRRAAQAGAIALICADALPKRWGERIVVVGASGKGKTFFMQRLADYMAARVDLVLIHDAKDPRPQYRGAVRSTFEAVATNPPADTDVIVFHDVEPRVSPDDIAARALLLARTMGVTSAVFIDEVFIAMSGRQAWSSGPQGPVAEVLRLGRSRGISLVAGTQIPQTLPTELLDLAGSLVLFGIDGRSFAYIDRTEQMEPALAEVIPGLQRGECVVVQRGQPWNRTIYGPG